jgi:hypothetical protein
MIAMPTRIFARVEAEGSAGYFGLLLVLTQLHSLRKDGVITPRH